MDLKSRSFVNDCAPARNVSALHNPPRFFVVDHCLPDVEALNYANYGQYARGNNKRERKISDAVGSSRNPAINFHFVIGMGIVALSLGLQWGGLSAAYRGR